MNKKAGRSTAIFFVTATAFNWHPFSGAPHFGNAAGLETNTWRP